jgi:hypothetical protein
MTDIQNLKNLAESATPGPWECREAEGAAAICHQHGWVADDFSEQTLLDTRYMAAANPAAVLELIAENERLASQNKWFKAQIESIALQHAPMEPIPDAEGWSVKLPGYDLQTLLRDADRYRWLMKATPKDQYMLFSSLSNERVEALIDAQIAKAVKP